MTVPPNTWMTSPQEVMGFSKESLTHKKKYLLQKSHRESDGFSHLRWRFTPTMNGLMPCHKSAPGLFWQERCDIITGPDGRENAYTVTMGADCDYFGEDRVRG